jgi:3-deoxy-7-phosphoheptulonate synthase
MITSDLQRMITAKITPLPTPADLLQAHPLAADSAAAIVQHRHEIIDILAGKDARMLLIIGPCSEDDSTQPDGTPSVVHFARELHHIANDPQIAKHLKVVMRCPPAKPRSDVGLAGLEQKDITRAHELLTAVAELGVPLAIEVMGGEHLARYGHLLSMAWVGARNNKDTKLRHALSAYGALPVLCKNGEHGELKPALQAITTINQSHANASIILPDDRTAYVAQTSGNPHTGIIWRGGSEYMSPERFEQGVSETAATELPYAIDCAHGNEQAHDQLHQKSVRGQLDCFDHVLQLLEDRKLPTNPKALMVEGYLLAGADTSQQTPGQSWTDPCVDLATVRDMAMRLATVHATLQES